MTFVPTVKKLVTRPVLKFEKEKPFYVRLLAAMYTGAAPTPRSGSTRKPIAPTFIDVTNLDDKTEATLPIHPKLKAIFDAKYSGDSYVGKCFSVTAKTRQAGRQFAPYHLEEIEDPDAERPVLGESAPAHAAAAGGRRR